MITSQPSGHNIGELLRRGVTLTTREVLALTHEVCRKASATFPLSPDELWITDTGELLIARSDQVAQPIVPRNGVASLLEAMLPAPGAKDPQHVVPTALRGLPTRLRAVAADVGPQDRKDLMSILSWHLAGDPRQVIETLAARISGKEPAAVDEPAAAIAVIEPAAAVPVIEPAAAVPVIEPAAAVAMIEPAAAVPVVEPAAGADDDLDLFPERKSAVASLGQPSFRPRGRRAPSGLALLAVAMLFIAIGSASYWLFRVAPDGNSEPGRGTVVTHVETPPPTVPPLPGRVRIAEAPPLPAIVNAGEPQPLVLEVADGAFSPAFATTGRELFFHAGRAGAGRLLMANLDDSGQVSRVSAVMTDAARNYHPRLSPDGRWIAFDSDRDGERGVYVAARDGSNRQRVSGPGYAAVPTWSPDMKWLAFIRGEPARPRVWNLWLRDLSTGALQRHTAFRSGQVWGASWFPDGRSVCYSHDQQLIISHLDAREDIVIGTPRRGHLLRTPAVSPDGRRVVFQVFKDGVWLLDVQTRTMRRILDDATAEEFAWSPDGVRIVYHSRRDGEWRIWMMVVAP